MGNWTFTITAGTLTASGDGVASGTYGDKLSELTVSGLKAYIGTTEVAGSWKLVPAEDIVPNVGSAEAYTAEFTPAANADYYGNTLTANVNLDIAKADAPAIDDINVSYNWAVTGEQTVTLTQFPVGAGNIGTSTINVTDANGIIAANSAAYGQGRIRFTLNANTADKIGSTATIKVTIPSQNYKDIIVKVNVEITDKNSRTDKPDCKAMTPLPS